MGHHHDEAEEEQVPFRLEGASGAGRHIVVTAAKRRWLDEHLKRQWRRPPTAAESDRFVADFVAGDPVPGGARARARSRRPGCATAPGPEDGDARAPRRARGQRVRPDGPLPRAPRGLHPARVGLVRHVFFSAAIRGADARTAAGATLGQVRDHGVSGVSGLGGPPPMPPEVGDWTRPMVEARFGADFAASVFGAEPDSWSGPVASAYGWHLVYVTRRAPAQVPDFAEVAGHRDRPGRRAPRGGTGPHLRQGPGRLPGRDRPRPPPPSQPTRLTCTITPRGHAHEHPRAPAARR